MKKVVKFFFGRLTVTLFLILFQLVLLFFAIMLFTNSFIYIYFIMLIISFFLIIAIINDDTNPSFKIAWLIPMLVITSYSIHYTKLYEVLKAKQVVLTFYHLFRFISIRLIV